LLSAEWILGFGEIDDSTYLLHAPGLLRLSRSNGAVTAFLVSEANCGSLKPNMIYPKTDRSLGQQGGAGFCNPHHLNRNPGFGIEIG
jgi:hypothetical protein